ncbi:MAG TPA: hypothetical protein VEL74_08710, partial [Thermoanaerobaculia bacterium]|nr:hypothetical protein [Thermoanaerobaculia bacterium]
MLLLDSEIEVAGLTVFRDHASARTFHYLPGTPRVVTLDGGKPGLQLLRYRGGREGGFLTLDVDLTLDETARTAAHDELRGRFGGAADLVPVLFHEGTVWLTALGVAAGSGDNRFVERVLGTTVPSLLGGARAIFSLELDREGASLVEAAIGTEGTPLAVVYDLAYTGLRPARGLRARVRYGMAYDFLRTRLAANTLFFKADLDREAEALSREGHLEIEDVDYQGTDPEILARRQEEIRATLRELSEALFFRPAASPDSVRPGAPSAIRPQAAFVLRALEQREEQELAYDLRETAAVTRRVAPQGMLRLPAGADPAELVLDVTFEGPAVTEVRAFTLPGADWEGVEAIEVEVRGGGESRTLILSPETPDGAALLPPPSEEGPLEHRVRVLTRDEPEALGTPPDPDT